MTELSARPFSASERHQAVLCAARFCLDKRDIHIWCCSRNRIASSDEFKRRVLSHYAGHEPGAWQFGLGDQGKPHLLDTSLALDFNVSHSGDWLVCAVTAGTPVGVDVEECKPTRDVMTLARRFFREEEVAAMAACGDGAQCDLFYDLWTLKEAAVKARGSVLVSGLDSRGFALASSPAAVSPGGSIALTTPEDAAVAHYCLLELQPGYRVALCWLPGAPLRPRLQAFELCDQGVTRTLQLPLRASTWVDESA